MSLTSLADHLRGTLGFKHKLDIQPVQQLLRRFGAGAVQNGDDCAAIPDGDGYLLLAIEGLLPTFVEKEPWFAGYCAVMVNLSDVAAMGGRPIAVVDAIWTRDSGRAGPIWDGMTAAAAQYAVPIVGGHTNARSPAGDHLAAAVLGRARSLLTSFDARAGDVLIAAIDLRGDWFGPYPYWNASTTAPGRHLRGDLELLPTLAEAGLSRAAKDISMGGVVGTALMLAECSGVGFILDIDALPIPPSTTIEKWLTAFPSFGYLLAASPEDAASVCRHFAQRDIAAAVIGRCDSSQQCRLTDSSNASVELWDLAREPFIGIQSAVAEVSLP